MGTICGRADWKATRWKATAQATRLNISIMFHNCMVFVTASNSSTVSNVMQIPSKIMISLRRLNRSTIAPATGATIRFGSTASTPKIPKSTRSLVCDNTHNGNAKPVSVDPMNEIICPAVMMANLPSPGSVSADSPPADSTDLSLGWRPGLAFSVAIRLSCSHQVASAPRPGRVRVRSERSAIRRCTVVMISASSSGR